MSDLDQWLVSQANLELSIDVADLWSDDDDDGDGGTGDSDFKPQTMATMGAPEDESVYMAIKRHELEQKGHRRFAKVNAKFKEPHKSPGEQPSLGQGLKEHPLLRSQRFDGIDPTVSPAPMLNTDARREFDNLRNEQQLQKQMRLGNSPKMSAAKTPRPG